MNSKTKQVNLKYTKEWLRRHFPTHHPVRVIQKRTIKHPDCGDEDLDGLTLYDEKKQSFRIYLNKKNNTNKVIDDLLHEWPHCIRGLLLENSSYKVHDEIYWAIYGQIYRKWHGED